MSTSSQTQTFRHAMNLTDEEIRIKVAESLGWKIASRVQPDAKLHAVMCWVRPGGDDWHEEQLPNYHESLDACAKFEATLTCQEHLSFRKHLWDIVITLGPEDVWDRQFVSADAKTRCLAYLKTKGLIP